MSNLRFTIFHLMVFMALVAVQVQNPTMISRGFDVTILTIFLAFIGLMVSALASGAKNGQLDAESNPVFKFTVAVLIWCFVNLLISFVLHQLFPPPPYFDI